jgi:hypothetical protein
LLPRRGQGAFGFSSWLELSRGYRAVFVVEDDYANVHNFVSNCSRSRVM